MADFELLRLQDGNRVLETLDQTYEPPGVDYYHIAGTDAGGSDSIVSAKSATHDFDARACYRLFTEGAYPQFSSMKPVHGKLPNAPRIQDAALTYLAGEKSAPCQGTSGQQFGSPESTGEPAGQNPVTELLDALNPTESASTSTMESSSEGALYEPPVALSVAIDGGVYSMRLGWDAPGASNGHLSLLATNGTLPNATVTLRSPTGETTTLAEGDTTWATWSEPIEVDLDHAVEVGMPAAEQGAWTLWMNRTTRWPGFLFASLAFETDFGLETLTDDHGVIGEPLKYRIQPTNAGNPVLGAVVSLEFFDPALNATHPLVLLDDGLNGDEAAGDGVYSAQHIFLENGSFPYQATATFAGTQLHVEGATPILDEEEAPLIWPPSTPLNVTATWGPGGGEITLNWLSSISDGGSPLTGYDIYRVNETGVPEFLAAGNVTTYTDSDLGANATHTYAVTARNAAGYSRLSNETTATTFDVPSAPRNLTAAPGAAGEIVLQWEAPLDEGGSPVTNYTVYGGDSLGSEIVLATVGNVRTYTETGLDDNVTRFYKVAAATLAGPGAASESVNATTLAAAPSAPTDLTAMAGAGEVMLAWQVPVDDGGATVTGYRIFRGPTANQLTLIANATEASFTDREARSGATYHYGVAAANAIGQGAMTHAEATPYEVLLEIPPDFLARENASLRIDVCQSSTPECAASGSDMTCIQLSIADGNRTHVACLENALLTQEVASALQDLAPITVPLPNTGLNPGVGLRVTYTFDRTQLLAIAPDDAVDGDGDGFATLAEATAGSNPMQRTSTPLTDDDGDGRINQLEATPPALCTGAYGIVGGPGCGGYKNPLGWPAASTYPPPWVWQDSSGRNWVWDGICIPASQGDYATCKATGNRNLGTSGYHGGFTHDGYGWRRIVTTTADTTTEYYGVCADGIQDGDSDGIPSVQVCKYPVTIQPSGTVVQGAPQYWTTIGDPTSESSGSGLCLPVGLPASSELRIEYLGTALGEPITIPHLGQVAAAVQANAGVIPCG